MSANILQDLIDRIDDYCKDNLVSESKFGMMVLKDPTFVGDIKNRGRTPTLRTLAKINDWLDLHEVQAAEAREVEDAEILFRDDA